MLNIMEAATIQRYKALRAAENANHDYMYVNKFNNSLIFSDNGNIKVLAPPTMTANQSIYIDYDTAVAQGERDGSFEKPFASYEEASEFIPHDKNGYILNLYINLTSAIPNAIVLANQSDMNINITTTGGSSVESYIMFALNNCHNVNIMGSFTLNGISDCRDISMSVGPIILKGQIYNSDRISLESQVIVDFGTTTKKLVISKSSVTSLAGMEPVSSAGVFSIEVTDGSTFNSSGTITDIDTITINDSVVYMIAAECSSIIADSNSRCNVDFANGNLAPITITCKNNSNVTVSNGTSGSGDNITYNSIQLKKVICSNGGFVFLVPVTRYKDNNNNYQNPEMVATMAGTIIYAGTTADENSVDTVISKTENTAGRILSDQAVTVGGNISVTYTEDTTTTTNAESGSGTSTGD